jgi:hypothetical protein
MEQVKAAYERWRIDNLGLDVEGAVVPGVSIRVDLIRSRRGELMRVSVRADAVRADAVFPADDRSSLSYEPLDPAPE